MLPSARVSAEPSPMGRVYVPHDTPRGVALFYTTQEFPGLLDDRSVELIRQFVVKRFDIDAVLWSCHQVHGTSAVRVSVLNKKWPGARTSRSEQAQLTCHPERSGRSERSEGSSDSPDNVIKNPLAGLSEDPSLRWRFAQDDTRESFRSQLIASSTVPRAVPTLGMTHQDCDRCDALWTSERGAALGIKVADCLPVTLVDPQNSVIANIHSGWRGAAGRITALTLDRLGSESSFSPVSAHAFLGPSIRGCCFEVGTEVVEQFRSASPEMEKHVDWSRGERPYLDLVGLTTDLLSGYGIQRGSIHDTGLCTRCSGSDFHSYRRDRARTGRNLAIVAQ